MCLLTSVARAGAERTPGLGRAGVERGTGTKGAAGPKRTADVTALSDSDWVVTPGISACAGDLDGETAGPGRDRDGLAARVARWLCAGMGCGLSVAVGCGLAAADGFVGLPVDGGWSVPIPGRLGLPPDAGGGLAVPDGLGVAVGVG
jgi:hypothetical protein